MKIREILNVTEDRTPLDFVSGVIEKVYPPSRPTDKMRDKGLHPQDVILSDLKGSTVKVVLMSESMHLKGDAEGRVLRLDSQDGKGLSVGVYNGNVKVTAFDGCFMQVKDAPNGTPAASRRAEKVAVKSQQLNDPDKLGMVMAEALNTVTLNLTESMRAICSDDAEVLKETGLYARCMFIELMKRGYEPSVNVADPECPRPSSAPAEDRADAGVVFDMLNREGSRDAAIKMLRNADISFLVDVYDQLANKISGKFGWDAVNKAFDHCTPRGSNPGEDGQAYINILSDIDTFSDVCQEMKEKFETTTAPEENDDIPLE